MRLPWRRKRPTWFFCRAQQQGRTCCPAQCQVCQEDAAKTAIRAKGMVPR